MLGLFTPRMRLHGVLWCFCPGTGAFDFTSLAQGKGIKRLEKRVPASGQAFQRGRRIAPTPQHPVHFRLRIAVAALMGAEPKQDFGLGVGAFLSNFSFQFEPHGRGRLFLRLEGFRLFEPLHGLSRQGLRFFSPTGHRPTGPHEEEQDHAKSDKSSSHRSSPFGFFGNLPRPVQAVKRRSRSSGFLFPLSQAAGGLLSCFLSLSTGNGEIKPLRGCSDGFQACSDLLSGLVSLFPVLLSSQRKGPGRLSLMP